MSNKSNAVRGFTLIEMMMVLTIAGILLTVAVPSFRTFTQNNKLTKQLNLLSASVSLARGEAAKRGAKVVLCQSGDPTATLPTCSGTSGTWSNGWVVFVDADGGGENDIDVGEVLNVFQTEAGVNILTNANMALVFNPDGTTTEGGEVKFGICDSRGVSNGKMLRISATGRPNSGSADTCSPT